MTTCTMSTEITFKVASILRQSNPLPDEVAVACDCVEANEIPTQAAKKLEKSLAVWLKSVTQGIYESRRDREVNPEGEFDTAGRWYPSDVEDCDGSGKSTRSPSRSWPYSYMLRCRTRQHAANLVAAWLRGEEVPADVSIRANQRLIAAQDLLLKAAFSR